MHIYNLCFSFCSKVKKIVIILNRSKTYLLRSYAFIIDTQSFSLFLYNRFYVC